MKKGGQIPFKIIGIHANNHAPELMTTYEDRLDPLLRAHKQRKKNKPTPPDSIAQFMSRVESSYDELRVKARQSKYDLDAIKSMVSGIIKDANFGERIFFSFFERTRINPSLADLFANKTREDVKTIRAKFIEMLHDVNMLTIPARYRPTPSTVGITPDQYLQFDAVLQKVLEIEDLPQLILPIAKERIFILLGEVLQAES
jgi:hypothetical protein